jgi:hypothetical protein
MAKKVNTKKTQTKDKVKKSMKSTKTKTNKTTKANNQTSKVSEDNSGRYIFFRNPKYRKFAQIFSEKTPNEIKKIVEKENLMLNEKIHIGNMLCNLAAKLSQQGQFELNDEKVKALCYSDKNKFKDLYTQNMNKTRAELQRLCALNDLPKSAGKEVLAERVADGILLGSIPKCPSCNGGRPRFNIFSGKYFCPGFIDGGYFYSDLGDDYVFCNKTFDLKDITRGNFKTNKI